jgi:hypothetical protein
MGYSRVFSMNLGMRELRRGEESSRQGLVLI